MRMPGMMMLLGVCLLTGCVAETSTTTTSSTPTSVAQDDRFAAFAPCDTGGAPGVWLCGTLDVPLDRADPASGSISIKVWARPRTDTSGLALEPIFTTPGGPGAPGLENYGVAWLPTTLGDARDFITIDPRGTGDSGAIDCPDLQDGFSDLEMWAGLVGECGASLVGGSGRYGAVDRALDVEAVRLWLGYDRIVYYGPSFAGVDAQAYAVRFPERLSAVILDSSFPVDLGYEKGWAAYQVENWLRIADLVCPADPVCDEASSDPRGSLSRLVEAIANDPLAGTASNGMEVVIDEIYLAEAVSEMDLPALIVASVAYESGDAQGLLDFAARHPSWYRSGGYGPDARRFSAGASVAGYCNDITYPYGRGDSVEVRQQKLVSVLAGLPADIYAPWSPEAISSYVGFDQCVLWPVPDRHEPVIPPGTPTSGVPTLILSGDLDRLVPTEFSRRLLDFFPGASFVVVSDAGHPTLSKGQCVSELISHFIDTLEPIGGDHCG